MTGTIYNPAKFSDVVNCDKIIPGDTIVMRGGTYTGDWVVTVSGSAENPVKFISHSNEVVIIRGSLILQGQYTEWSNITIQQPDTTKPAIHMTAVGTKLIDCDISGGFIGVEWFGSGIGKLLRCNIHNTTSYGMYTHNNGGGLREIADSMIYDTEG